MSLKLGIIAGGGLLPAEIANLYSKNGGEVCIAALDGETDSSLIAKYKHKVFPIGSVGSLLKYFTLNKVKEIIIIGSIKRPDLKSIKVDMVGSILLAKILKNKLLGDDNILKIIADFIENKGFKVISPNEILEVNDNECITKYTPSKKDRIDIELGVKILAILSQYDIGQSIIVIDGYVLGIEAAEGTDNLIRRCEALRKREKGGTLIKMAKVGQDMRLDLPTIGPDTIFYIAKHGFSGIAIEKTKVMIVKPEETLDLLNKNGLFISYI